MILFSVKDVHAIEPIMITISSDMNNIFFDGRWTDEDEWKRSSWNTLTYDDGTQIQLRTAHQDNFIYVFVDAVTDTHFDSDDKSTVCLDTTNNKSIVSEADDYCFTAILNEKTGITLQGESGEAKSNFKKIPNPANFVGIGGIPDENDRYTKVPHTSYEFRIPTDFVGRSNNYGFYLSLYDMYSDKVYSWPPDISSDRFEIPSPSLWGDIVSPDNTLPEFRWPMFALLPALLFVAYITKFRASKQDMC